MPSRFAASNLVCPAMMTRSRSSRSGLPNPNSRMLSATFATAPELFRGLFS